MTSKKRSNKVDKEVAIFEAEIAEQSDNMFDSIGMPSPSRKDQQDYDTSQAFFIKNDVIGLSNLDSDEKPGSREAESTLKEQPQNLFRDTIGYKASLQSRTTKDKPFSTNEAVDMNRLDKSASEHSTFNRDGIATGAE